MCGIIGYKGFRSSQEVLLKGLESMEYRGYDSAGIVVSDKNNKEFKKIRAVGSLQKLKDRIKTENFGGSLGIGHIRWATHGPPLEKNAHPHQAQDIYLVHNGVIENTEDLKKHIKNSFLSDTDSEVLAHYLVYLRRSHSSLKSAIFTAMSQIKGEYAVVILSETNPGEMIGFKKGPSLAVGFGEKEIFLASDFHAFLPYVGKVIFLKDEEMVYVPSGHKIAFEFYSGSEKNKVQPIVHSFKKSYQKIKPKKEKPHYMLQEIYEQPAGVSRVIQNYVNVKKQSVQLLKKQEDILDYVVNSNRLFITACGSSYYASLYAKYLIEQTAHLPVEVDISSEFRYRSPILGSQPPIMVISQSGETADTLAVLRLSLSLSCPVFSLCNTKQSVIDRESSAQFYMLAGEEKSVASTKAFINTLVVLFLINLWLARRTNQINSSVEKQWIRSLLQLPSQMEEVLASETLFAKTAQFLKQMKRIIYLGRGSGYPIILEGALKMKELTYRHAEGYPAGEMKHGPLALVDRETAVVAVAPSNGVHHSKMLINLEEARTRGGQLIIIGTQGDQKSQSLAKQFLPLPLCHESLSPILSTIPLQLLAYHLACLLGYSVDQPRNLAKSVTVE